MKLVGALLMFLVYTFLRTGGQWSLLSWPPFWYEAFIDRSVGCQSAALKEVSEPRSWLWPSLRVILPVVPPNPSFKVRVWFWVCPREWQRRKKMAVNANVKSEVNFGLAGFGEFSSRLFWLHNLTHFCVYAFLSCLCSNQGNKMRASSVLL